MKKLMIIMISLPAAVLYGQNNTLSAGAGMGFNVPALFYNDFSIGYERAVTARLALTLYAAYQIYPFAGEVFKKYDVKRHSFAFGGGARLYPGKGVFHLDAGVGYSRFLEYMHSILAVPGFGWKIPLGARLALDIALRTEVFVPLGDNIAKGFNELKGDFFPMNGTTCFMLGYRF